MIRSGSMFLLLALVLAVGCDTAPIDVEGPEPDDDATQDDDDNDDDVTPHDDDTDDDDTADDDAGDDDTVADDDDVGDDDTGVPPVQGCWTLSVTVGQLIVVEVDISAGTWSEVGRWGEWIDPSFHTAGFALLGDELVTAGNPGEGWRWMSVDLVQDTVTWGGNTDEMAVTSDGTDLIAMCEYDSFCRYPDFASLSAGSPSAVIPADIWATRLTTDGTSVYTAWHSTDTIDVYDLATGTHTSTIPLQDWDTWIWGMSVVGDDLYLMHRDNGFGHRFARFDVATGTLLEEMYFGPFGPDHTHGPSGLWCE